MLVERVRCAVLLWGTMWVIHTPPIDHATPAPTGTQELPRLYHKKPTCGYTFPLTCFFRNQCASQAAPMLSIMNDAVNITPDIFSRNEAVNSQMP